MHYHIISIFRVLQVHERINIIATEINAVLSSHNLIFGLLDYVTRCHRSELLLLVLRYLVYFNTILDFS